MKDMFKIKLSIIISHREHYIVQMTDLNLFVVKQKLMGMFERLLYDNKGDFISSSTHNTCYFH